ncbi:glycosyltransferase family 2 protein [Nocardioides sp. GXZ039]|uniref:glycosyltransferase family 2 protein n=1 Tax=Nocardioides sp. GXZ039 TaxID=3136018 RepID=UPI0030F379AA
MTGLVLAVSTVKDSPTNVARYIERNLANGIDHLVVFTEQTGAEAEAILDAHPHVTHVPTGRGWWGEWRSDDLNVRQRTAANLTRVLLAPFEWAEWIVHIDGDEVALIDRDVVDALPESARTLKLDPLEAVSRESWPDGRITHFKRLLTDGEANVLRVLGLIPEPNNKAYFHGHVRGKRGVRVRTDLRMGLHVVKSGKGRFVKGVVDPGLRMLHYDSATSEEFARKWMTLASSKSRAVYRTSRIPVVRALKTLSRLRIPDEVRERYIRRIYDLTTLEDFDTLNDLGLLVEVHPEGGTHRPQAVPAEGLAAFERLLAAAAEHPRATLTIHDHEGGYDVLRDLLEATGTPVGAAAEILDYIATKPVVPLGPRERRGEAEGEETDGEGADGEDDEDAGSGEDSTGAVRARLKSGRRLLDRMPQWRA